MAVTVKDLMTSARTVLNDLGVTPRWPLVELLDWINFGAARICTAKPNANVAPLDVTLIAGTEQALPPGTTGLVRVFMSMTGPKRAVTIVSRKMLDAFCPGWHDPATFPAAASIDHVIYDPADPDVFMVYPPNDGTGTLRAEFAINPVPIAAPSLPTDINQYSMPIPLGDDHMGALLDYVLYRAFAKDANMPNMAARSAGHFQQFQIAIGEKVQKDMMMNVTTSHALPKT